LEMELRTEETFRIDRKKVNPVERAVLNYVRFGAHPAPYRVRDGP
jgi:hypothetical protein